LYPKDAVRHSFFLICISMFQNSGHSRPLSPPNILLYPVADKSNPLGLSLELTGSLEKNPLVRLAKRKLIRIKPNRKKLKQPQPAQMPIQRTAVDEGIG